MLVIWNIVLAGQDLKIDKMQTEYPDQYAYLNLNMSMYVVSLGFACFGFCLISCKAKNAASFSHKIVAYWVAAIIVYYCFSLNTVYNHKFCTLGKKDFGTLIEIIHWMI